MTAMTLEEWAAGVGQTELPLDEPRETYDDWVLRGICKGDRQKMERIRNLPLTQLALNGKVETFDLVNGNKGLSYHARKHKQKETK
jgi:hypothetical protein